ncbi:MAG: peptidylprolyl isomerase [Bacteroidales bacterium]|nr:peptidylprolyl isomerase [Bacteroidales bacterium]
MKKLNIFLLFITFLGFFACINHSLFAQDEKIILISTSFGDIKIKLYNETPKHRDNFINLVSENFYDSLLFHRVINEFMIQGGDPDSKNAEQGETLGNGGPGYTVEAEFNENFIHKKGVIAAARENDDINPEKRSSGSQFYIVQGKVFTNEELNNIVNRTNNSKKQKIITDHINKSENSDLKNEIDSLKQIGDNQKLQEIFTELENITQEEYENSGLFSFTEHQRQIYTTVGGTPHLDGAYTVFGEVIEGLDIIDKIAVVDIDQYYRPVEDIKMNISIVQ